MKPSVDVYCTRCGALAAHSSSLEPTSCHQCGNWVHPPQKSWLSKNLTWIFLSISLLWVAILGCGFLGVILWKMGPGNVPQQVAPQLAQAPKPVSPPDMPVSAPKESPTRQGVEKANAKRESQSPPQKEEVAKGNDQEPAPELNSPSQTKVNPTVTPAAAPVRQGRPKLAYRWAESPLNAWQFEIKVPASSGAKSFTGVSSFTARRKTNLGVGEKKKGTGTAFVVDGSGILVTCAHVVDNASSIKVLLGGKSFPAEVVASDPSQDIAILKIESSEFKALGLASADSVELAQEVRSVGFPLSDVLGDSVKVTRGTISGKVQREGRELYQIDAAINPGNSGGPVIDLRGNVVGMASEKIHGQAISNVGFCIPSKTLDAYLREHQVELPVANKPTVDFDGPALARAVTPSVAMVEVEQGSGEAFELVDSSVLYSSGDRPYGLPTARRGSASPGTLTMNGEGEVLELEGGLQSPFLFGPVATLSIVPLPRPWQTRWGGTRNFKLSFLEEERSQDPFDRIMQSRYRRYSPFAPPVQQRVVTVEGVESEDLKILETKENLITIEKTWRMAIEASPKIEVGGTWTYAFDSKLGAVQEVKGKGKFQVGDKSISSIEISLTPVVVSSIPSGPAYETPKNYSSPPTVAQITPAEISEPIKQLADTLTGNTERIRVLEALAKATVNSQHRNLVLDCLEKEMVRPEVDVAVAAIKALTHWDAATRVESVVKLLKHDASQVREAVVAYLASMQDGSATPALVEALGDTLLRPSIYAALRSIGPTGEKGVIAMLSHKEVEVRSEGCRILAEIGTTKCVDELRRIARSEDGAHEIAKQTLAKLGQSVTEQTISPPATSEENPFEPKKKP